MAVDTLETEPLEGFKQLGTGFNGLNTLLRLLPGRSSIGSHRDLH